MMKVRTLIYVMFCLCLSSCRMEEKDGTENQAGSCACLLSAGCYEDRVTVDASRVLANAFVRKVTSLSPYNPDSLCDFPFFELYNPHAMPYFDKEIFTYSTQGFSDNHYAKSSLYQMIQEIKIRCGGKWYAHNDLSALCELSVSSWTDPISNQSMLEPYVFLTDSIHWSHYEEEKNEKISLTLSDGQPIAFSEPLKWSVACDYCVMPVSVEYPFFAVEAERIAVVSSLILVRDFRMKIPTYDVDYDGLRVSADSVRSSRGIFLLGKIYKFVPLR